MPVVSRRILKIQVAQLMSKLISVAGRGAGARGADWDEAGDGAVHEDAGEGHL